MFSAGMMRYVSSAYLMISLLIVTGRRSPVLTTYEAGLSADPWIELANIFTIAESSLCQILYYGSNDYGSSYSSCKLHRIRVVTWWPAYDRDCCA